MQIQKISGLTYFQFESLALPGIFQAVFTRLGGVSPAPWDSLNLGGTVGDDAGRVYENLRRLVQASGFQLEDLVQVKQIHSATVIPARGAMDVKYEGDAIITDQSGLLLLMRYADCVPILVADPVNQAVGIAHAGWQGTVKEVSSALVRRMQSEFGSKPDKLLAGIGPSIGPDHYPVGMDVIKLVEDTFKGHEEDVLSPGDDGVKFNLWEANRISLSRAGVKSIEIAEICTACEQEHWYSHRGANGKTGRFAAVIGLL